MTKITETITVPKYQASIRIVDGMALLVAENGNGKTALLNEIAHGDFQTSSPVDAVYHLGFEEECPSALELLRKTGVTDAGELYARIEPYMSKGILNFMKERIHLEDLSSGKMDENFAWRRLMLTALLRTVTKERFLLLFDEPELMAHPLMRNEMTVLLKQIRKEGNTVIVATNLDNVVADLVSSPEQIVRLETQNGQTNVYQPDLAFLERKVKEFYHADPMLLRRFSGDRLVYRGLQNVVDENYANYIASTLKKELFDISFARNVIIGEGASEGVLFDYASDGLYPEWIRKHRVSFVHCLGKATMPLFFLFFNELGIRVICMTDYDNNTNRVHNAYRNALNRYEAQHPGLFRHLELRPDLEGYLHIDSDERLEPIEKPVNVYVHTYGNGEATNRVLGLMTEWYKLIEEMEKTGS